MGSYVTKKKDMVFKNIQSLRHVEIVIDDATEALNDKSRTISESAIPNYVRAALGSSEPVGHINVLPAVLRYPGAAIIGGVAAGALVLAAPMPALAGVGVAKHMKGKHLKYEKARVYYAALEKRELVMQALKDEGGASRERLDYLEGLGKLLETAIRALQQDLGIDAEGMI